MTSMLLNCTRTTGMLLNCTRVTGMLLNCNRQSGCMTINCPPYCLMTQQHSSCGGPRDSLIQNNDTTYYASSSCPDLDPSSFTDSLQTHDSLAYESLVTALSQLSLKP